MTTFSVKPLEGVYANIVDKAFGYNKALYEFNPGKCLLPSFFAQDAQKILDFAVREDDVWLISFPRTGSTWCQEMIWLISNNYDYETARNTVQQIRAPLLELSTVLFEYEDSISDIFLKQSSVDYVRNMESPRFIKSHLPLELLPTQLNKIKPKIIYTMRNPKDLCVSYFHHCQMFHNLTICFEEFCDLFLNESVPLGSIWNHYFGFWNKRHERNILVLRYEDMKNNLEGTLLKIADHLEKPITQSDIEKMSEFLTVKSMRENKGCNLQTFIDRKNGSDYYKKVGKHFIRKGIVGDWKNHMSPVISEKFDKWIEVNTKGTDLTF